jgi:hypothetical protein
MANQRKTYFLCPTWDYHPDGPIQLGSIILSPRTPAETINPAAARVPPPPDALFPATSQTGVTWTREHHAAGRYGLWTRFLESSSSSVAGGGGGAGIDASVRAARTHAPAPLRVCRPRHGRVPAVARLRGAQPRGRARRRFFSLARRRGRAHGRRRCGR